jgi:hypothetical protein
MVMEGVAPSVVKDELNANPLDLEFAWAAADHRSGG